MKDSTLCILLMKDTITCKLYETQISVSISKVLLVHSNVHLFIYYLSLLLHYSAKLNSCDKDYIVHKA